MKRFKITCDRCGVRIVKGDAARQVLELDMITHGYDERDGHHRYRFDICTAKCGLDLLRIALEEIDTGETLPRMRDRMAKAPRKEDDRG